MRAKQKSNRTFGGQTYRHCGSSGKKKIANALAVKLRRSQNVRIIKRSGQKGYDLYCRRK